MNAIVRPFVFEEHEYTRDGDPVETWVRAQTDYISKLYGYDEKYVEEWVRKEMQPGGCTEFYDRKVQLIEQVSLGNRELKVLGFKDFQDISREEGYVLSPSQTAYKDPVKNPSLPAKFTNLKAKERSVYKKKGQDAKVVGNMLAYSINNVIQANKKELNNSFSGANSSWFNSLCNASGHQALTSTCRSATSYANMVIEKFTMGNRMYIKSEIVLQELSNACILADHKSIMEIVNEYKLKIPTVKDVLVTAKKSYKKYFKASKKEAEIKLFISTMSDAARCAFVYLGDLYHLDKFNPTFVEDLFKEMFVIGKQHDSTKLDHDYFSEASDDIKCLVFSVMKEFTKGKVYKEFSDDVKAMINTTTAAYNNFFRKYERFINVLWRPNYLPSGMAYLRLMLREAILTSDTDSAIGTTQYWTRRMTGSYNFNEESFMTCFNLVYMCSESVANIFGKFCANMGVPHQLIRDLGAKNEYYFPIYTLTEQMKHYFAWKWLEEGRVLKEPELEMKGVGFISSRNFKEINAEFDEYIEKDILGNIFETGKLTVEQILDRPMKLEQKVRQTIRDGGITYQTDRINAFASYKRGEKDAMYKQYLLWDRVFSQTYGKVDEPPFSTYKVPVALSKARDIERWINSIDDPIIAGNLRRFMADTNTTTLSAIQVPTQIAFQSGIPKEITQIADEKRATSQIMGKFYLAFTGLGLIAGNNKNSRLISDYRFSQVKTQPVVVTQ